MIEGVVVAEGSTRPLAGAAVSLRAQERWAIADTAGRFRLRGVAPGVDTLQVTMLGHAFDPVPVTIGAGGRYRVELAVAYPSATLEELVVEVAGRVRERLRGFESRRRRGLGSFVTREEIERRDPALLSWMLRDLPRVRADLRTGRIRLDTRGAGLALRSGRTATGEAALLMRDGGTCAPAIFVDGVKRGPLTRVDDFRPEEVEAIEVYTSPFIPARFQDFLNRCGSVVLWRRGGRPPT